MPTVVELKATELNPLGGVHCPMPGTPSWNSHPKVFIDIAKHGHGACHYCGTEYKLAAGEIAAGAH